MVHITTIGTVNTVTTAKNLPITTSQILTGVENNNWSVFCFCSSAKRRIVSIGNTTVYTKLILLSVFPIAALPPLRFTPQKYTPTTNRKNAIIAYPNIEVK